MKKKSTLTIGGVVAVLLVLGVLASCKNNTDKTPAEPSKIAVVKVLRQNVPVYQEFVGQVYGEQDIVIRARVEGFLEGIHFSEGTRVKKGQLLYTIDPAPFEARVAAQMSNLAEAKTMLAKAESDLNRIKPLAQNNAVSQSDLDAATAQFEAARASVDAAEANLQSAKIELGYTRIHSPINGLIGKTQATVGDFVGRSPNPVVLNTVSNIDKVLVEFFLSESEYLDLAEDMLKNRRMSRPVDSTGKAPLKMILANGMVYPETGHLRFVDREVDPTTGSILLQAEFPNPDRIIRPGQFARVEVKMSEIKNAMLIPKQAVNEVQGAYNVFVVNDSSRVEIHPVTLYSDFNDYDVIATGLEGNELVILEGIQMVRSGMIVEPVITTYQSKVKQNQ
ncbi:MAG: efflux RND transporter periplasmic adaptor subunit [Bacteroidales bacterium]